MYRLLKCQRQLLREDCICACSSHSFSHFCRMCFQRLIVQPREGISCLHDSSSTQPMILTSTKYKKKKVKNFTNILEVSKNKEALIKKLSSRNFINKKPKAIVINFQQSLRCFDPVIYLPLDLNSFVEDLLQEKVNKKKEITSKINSIFVKSKTKLNENVFQDSLNPYMKKSFSNKFKELRKELNNCNAPNSDSYVPNSDSYVPKLEMPLVVDPTENIVTEDFEINSINACLVDDGVEVDEVENTPTITQTKKLVGYKTCKLQQKTTDLLTKHRLSEMEKAGREETLNKNLLAFVDVCVNNNLELTALSAIKMYVTSQAKDVAKVVNVDIFNTLMAGFAGKGSWLKLIDVLNLLNICNLRPNCRTYACILECLGRHSDHKDNTKLIQKYIAEMKNDKFTLNDIFIKCQLVRDQSSILLETIRKIVPNFIPTQEPLQLDYECSLLEDLNRSHQVSKTLAEDNMTHDQLKELTKQQLKSELDSFVKIKTIENRDEPTETILYFRQKLEETQNEWRKAISDALQRDMKTLKVHSTIYKFKKNLSLFPYINCLENDEYVEILIHEIRKLAEGSETYSPVVTSLYRSLGEQVYIRYQINCKRNALLLNKLEKIYDEYTDWYLHPNDTSNTRQKWQLLNYTHNDGPNLYFKDILWPNSVLTAVGKFLYNIIIRDIKIDVNVMKKNSAQSHFLPAFYTLFRNHGRIIKEGIKPHPVLSRLFRGAAPEELVFHASFVPMLCPPKPWTTVDYGGYLITKTDLIRLPCHAIQQRGQLENTKPAQMYPTLDALNQLGAIPWRVNESILDILLNVFNSGGSSKLDVPEPPSSVLMPELTSEPSDRGRVYRQRLALRRRKAEMYSLWCDALYRLSLANHFRDKTFWLPHNIDFRGRTYPCPPHLNHLGSDMARSLLVFAKKERLGPKGLDWIKIHLINLTGTKKKNSIQERLDYANEIMPEILDSATNPLDGRMWWSKSDEPWQTLAACIEIKNALDSGDPENYLSGFPVHQDGSCNGLQHYAALGRDESGGHSVNLTPADHPQDVYSCVVQLVERERAKDAANDMKLAQVLEGFVSRKVIKQTVMTTVYGVTRYGARLQIARQLKDIDEFPKEYVWQASQYLVGKTFESLQEMFTSTKEIQDWFTECARLISQIRCQNVEWVTPLGLPIVQPYHRSKKAFKTNLNAVQPTDLYDKPNVMKQKNAFPPNFIHSLDSSHMMLTSLFCERAGITFVSVHDCFWTHPGTVSIMNQICRKQFVALHSQPLLEDLSKYFIKKYGFENDEFDGKDTAVSYAKRRLNNVLTEVPSTGSLRLEDVLNSTYFFS